MKFVGGNHISTQGENFSLYYCNLEPTANIHAQYSNDVWPIDGHISQWIYSIDGAGKIKINFQKEIIEEININERDFIKLPNLNEKTVYYVSSEKGWNYLTFNPNPYSDDYDAEKINIYSDAPYELEIKNYDRYVVLFDGMVRLENNLGTKKDLFKKTSIKIKAGSQVKLCANSSSIVGVFWKI